MVRVLKDSFKNTLPTDRKRAIRYLPTGKGRRIVKIPRPFFLNKHCICGHKCLYVD